MAVDKFVLYLRVSTQRQAASGLGIEAQRKAAADFLNGGRWTIVQEFVEAESGKRDDRPELAKAIEACRLYGAKLLIAKLDRLSRDAHFLLGLEKAGVEFVCADMPNANRLTVGIMAMVAEEERRMISARTKAALQAAKARGKVLGGFRGYIPTADDVAASRDALKAKGKAQAARLEPTIREIKATGITSASGIARALTERGIPTARGASDWTAVQVQRVLARLDA
ncbi:Resolvase domain protein [Methylorubrum extorquens]|uniref:Resolvase domain protein n=1 Tax=Methylorubrum extorquens TaxID=408 RepID=A0A2N9ASI2_METEX|nr:Resolvase domain protein [Methylorubrum extorquens]